jgi:2-oxoglutarate dehydrogenase E1 component
MLRRHTLGDEHRPLIVFTPKSMLRRKEAASQPSDFTEGTFRPLIGDEHADPAKVDALLLCSGRITWDLFVERKKQQGDELTTAIARVERLYPRPEQEIIDEIKRYPNLKTVRWVQDEPANMGPAPHYRLTLFPKLDVDVEIVSRPASSSPSVGVHARHVEQQKSLMSDAFRRVIHRPRHRGAAEAAR